MPIPRPISPEDSWAIELNCGSGITGTFYTGTYGTTGTYNYYSVDTIIDMIVHTGTTFQIRTGTFADYHSQRKSDDNAGRTSVDVYALEGEWKICRPNENNPMVVDVAIFPIVRNGQNCRSDDNADKNVYEYPHRHMTPHLLSGTTSVLWEGGGTYENRGLVTYGNYVFFFKQNNSSDMGLCRVNINTGSESWLDESTVNVLGYSFDTFDMAVLNEDEVIVCVYTEDYEHLAFVSYNFATLEFKLIYYWPQPVYFYNYDGEYYPWSWGIVGTKLCICFPGGNYIGDTSEYLENYRWKCSIIDYTTGNVLQEFKTDPFLNHSLMQYPICNTVIAGKTIIFEYHFGYTKGDPPASNLVQMFLFDCENNTITRYNPQLWLDDEPTPGEGAFIMTHLTHNPLDNNLYFVYYRTDYYPSNPRYGFGVGKINLSDLSTSSVYQYSFWYEDFPPDEELYQPVCLFPGMFDIYVMMESGDIYKLSSFPGNLGNPVVYIPPVFSSYWYAGIWDYPQPRYFSSCLDRWDRLWHIAEDGCLKAINLETGQKEIDIDVVASPKYSKISLTRNKILVLNSIPRPTGYNSIDRIYVVE